jgi:4-aminobutyrate aminotransferase-like enzyme
MGDVHPHALKARLARELSRITFERWRHSSNRYTVKSLHWQTAQRFNDSTIHAKTIFSNSGFEAVESALKTAMLATGQRGVIAFEGAYHGLGYGALNATHREHFRDPFRSQLREFGRFVRFPTKAEHLAEIEKKIRKIFRREKIGAILVEPVQARGGINVPPPEFLPLLRKLCDEFSALLIADEIYTGFGRTGKWFACEHAGVSPDLICLGKALTGGFPLSACVGRADLMDAAWPASRGEAMHTSTFLGHPVGCAMALVQIAEIERLKLPERAAELGDFLLAELKSFQYEISNLKVQINTRGAGLMIGVELRRHDGSPATVETFVAIKMLLQRGFIFLPEGEFGNVISFTPPLTITKAQLSKAVAALKGVLTTDEHR